MTIDFDNTRRLEFIGNGSDINFPYDFRIFEDTDLNVFVDKVLQIVNADYTVTGVNQQGGGNVNFLIAPEDQSEIIIDSDVPALQSVDFEVGGKLGPDTLNLVNDKLTVIDQQTKSLIQKRGLLYSETAFLDKNGKDNALPILQAQTNTEIPVWSKDKNNNIIATTIEESGDLSNLRAELASEEETSQGADLVGYYDEFDCNAPVGKTVGELLRQIAPLFDCRIAAVNTDDPTKRMRFDLSDLSSNTTAVFKIHDNPSGGVPTGGTIYWPSKNEPDNGWLICDGRDIDVLSDTAPKYAIDLFNAIEDEWGVGSETYVDIANSGAVRPVFAASVGPVTTPPSPGSTGFTLNVTVNGDNLNRERVEITCVAGNSVPPGSFFTLYSPINNRPNLVWYIVDGIGSEPVSPGSLIKSISILSSDTAEVVAAKTKNIWATQLKIPDLRGVFLRGLMDSGVNRQAYLTDDLSPSNEGTGYVVSDVMTLDIPGSQVEGTVTVTSVGGSGEVTGLSVLDRGRFFPVPGPGPWGTIGGSGTGCSVDINTASFDPNFPGRLAYSWTPSSESTHADDVIGNKIASYQRDAFRSHSHDIQGNAVTNPGSESAYNTGSTNPAFNEWDEASATNMVGAEETRGVNVAINHIIKT